MILQDDQIELSAALEIPEAHDGHRMVILLHGFTGTKDRPHNILAAASMREAGFATLRLDLYGHGDEDDTVPLADSAAYAQRYARCDLQVLSGESHHFDRKPEQMRTILREWMKKQRTVC